MDKKSMMMDNSFENKYMKPDENDTVDVEEEEDIFEMKIEKKQRKQMLL